jgi:excisionase family DNA binding protein
MDEQSSVFLTTNDVAKWLRVAPRTVCVWAECAELPGLKIGRQWRFRREAILEWVSRAEPDRTKFATEARGLLKSRRAISAESEDERRIVRAHSHPSG